MPKTIYSDEYRSLLESLRTAREAQGITQGALAERLGESQQWLSVIERGSRRVDVEEFVRICVALDLDPHAVVDPMVTKLRKAAVSASRKRR